jgi:hypothetical protein
MRKVNHKRQAVWAHNGLSGCVALAQKNMSRIQASATTTPNAKQLAAKIERDLIILRNFLKVRVDAN